MARKTLSLACDVYRGPAHHHDGRKKYTAVLEDWDPEYGDWPSLIEQVESCDQTSVGPHEQPVKIELDAFEPKKAWILWDPDQSNAGEDFHMKEYMEKR